jgi:uncharacterized protein YoaH (UPF0181 family)
MLLAAFQRRFSTFQRTIEFGQYTRPASLGSGRSIAPDELSFSTQQSPRSSEFVMRSNQIHKALAQGMNRFEVCQLVAKGVKATHKTGSRFEDSINDVLQYLGTHDKPKEGIHPAIPQVSVKSLKPAA